MARGDTRLVWIIFQQIEFARIKSKIAHEFMRRDAIGQQAVSAEEQPSTFVHFEFRQPRIGKF